MLKVGFKQRGNNYYHIMAELEWMFQGDEIKDYEILKRVLIPINSLFKQNHVHTMILKDKKTLTLELIPNQTIFKVKDDGHNTFINAVMNSLYELGYQAVDQSNSFGFGNESLLIKREDFEESELDNFDINQDLGLVLRKKRMIVPTFDKYKCNYIWFVGLWTQPQVEKMITGFPKPGAVEFQLHLSSADPTFVVYVKYASQELFKEIISKFDYTEESIVNASDCDISTSCFVD